MMAVQVLQGLIYGMYNGYTSSQGSESQDALRAIHVFHGLNYRMHNVCTCSLVSDLQN